MPPEGDPLTPAEVGLLARWIAEGAKDDPASTTIAPRPPPRYVAQPVITSLAWSPDNQSLAVAGNGEVFWFAVTNFTRRARLLGAGVRVESIQYSPDGKTLAVAGGTPSRFGELQWWDSVSGLLVRSIQVGRDSLLSVSWSPDNRRVAVGGADKMVRVFTVAEGRELFHFDQHSDWVFGACFTLDGRSVISASRDRTMKLIDATDGRMLDEICRPNEPLIGVVRHPTENLVANLGAEARVRVFKAQPKPDNHDPNADPNFVREYEHFDGGLTAATYSSDGKWFALAGAPAGEVRIHHGATSARQARLQGHEGLVFGLAFSPDGKRLATAGFEGLVRVFAWEKQHLEAIFTPVSPESDFAIGNQSGNPSAKNPH